MHMTYVHICIRGLIQVGSKYLSFRRHAFLKKKKKIANQIY